MALRIKLLLVFCLLAASVLVATLVAVRFSLEASTRANASVELDRLLRQVEAEVESRARNFDVAVTAALGNMVFVEALGTANDLDAQLGLSDEADTGLLDAHELIASADLPLLKSQDVFALVNAQGRLVFSLQAPEAVGADLSGEPLVKSALSGRPSRALWSAALAERHAVRLAPPSAPGELLLVFAKRIERGQVLGAILSGFRVRRALVEELQPMVGGRLFVRAPDGAVATSAGQEATLPDEGRLGTAVEIEGRTHLVQLGALVAPDGAKVGEVALLLDVDGEVDRFFARVQDLFELTAAVVLGVAVVAAFLISRRLSRPLVELAEAARRIRHGELAVALPPSGRDEVGRLAEAFGEMVEGLKQRDQIKGLFKRYLNPVVVEELLRHPERAAPGGQRRELTVLFCDLAGFTTLSERLSPEELVAFLNEYFEAAVGVLARRGATLDKFIGDAVMCFWNAPLPEARHAALACQAAVELSQVVEALAPRFEARGLGHIDCRIGLNTGPCVVGNIGSKDAQDYTAVGDTVNLASRLEGAAKVYGVRTLVSEQTVRAAGEGIRVRELDLLRVKGRHEPVRVYSLVTGPEPEQAHVLADYAEGWSLYHAGNFAAARERFLRGAGAGDAPSKALAARCQALAAKPPLDWSGVFALDEK